MSSSHHFKGAAEEPLTGDRGWGFAATASGRVCERSSFEKLGSHAEKVLNFAGCGDSCGGIGKPERSERAQYEGDSYPHQAHRSNIPGERCF